MEPREIALAIAKANRHPDPGSYADAVARAAAGGEAWPEVIPPPPAPEPPAPEPPPQ
jgi:hypothetical protein